MCGHASCIQERMDSCARQELNLIAEGGNGHYQLSMLTGIAAARSAYQDQRITTPRSIHMGNFVPRPTL